MTKPVLSIHQPTLLSAGLFATAILAWCYRLLTAAASSASTGKHETIDDDNQDDVDRSLKVDDQPLLLPEKNTTALAIPTFAWETAPIVVRDEKSSVGAPLTSSNSNQQNKSPSERLITTRHISGDEAEKSLEFFASMTFANGGLRAPSCPCCQ
jgi:hypothetical protein